MMSCNNREKTCFDTVLYEWTKGVVFMYSSRKTATVNVNQFLMWASGLHSIVRDFRKQKAYNKGLVLIFWCVTNRNGCAEFHTLVSNLQRYVNTRCERKQLVLSMISSK